MPKAGVLRGTGFSTSAQPAILLRARRTDEPEGHLNVFTFTPTEQRCHLTHIFKGEVDGAVPSGDRSSGNRSSQGLELRPKLLLVLSQADTIRAL